MDLEDEMEDLRSLDNSRIESAELREWGYDCLQQWVLDKPKEKDVLDHAPLIARVLLRKASLNDAVTAWMDATIRSLEALTLDQIADWDLHVLRATQVANALTAAPSSAFSKAVLYCYYWIVREINTANAPDWTAGGAPCGQGGLVTAFMTGQCIRALVGFARAQENTARLIRDLGAIRRRSAFIRDVIPPQWREADAARSSLSFFITLRKASANLAIHLRVHNPDEAWEFIADAPSRLFTDISAAKQVFAEAVAEIEKYRKAEKTKASRAVGERGEFERAHLGHWTGLRAVQRAQSNAEEALALFAGGPAASFDKWEELASAFDRAAAQVRNLLRPALGFVSRVLDREVAAALGGREFDASELAFAASAFGGVHGRWDEERLAAAADALASKIREDGTFPPGRPVHLYEEQGLQLYSGNSIHDFAQLLENVRGTVLTPKLVSRLLSFFERTRVEHDDKTRTPGGWRLEWGSQPHARVTAGAVHALDRLNRMLDRRINEMVLQHFSVQQGDGRTSAISLDEVFYSDFGLDLAPKSLRPEAPVAILLQRMRAHIAGIRVPRSGKGGPSGATAPPPGDEEPLYSVVLHGPPGTGKTTLLEALATSCGVQLVEVTPSDIVIRGEDSIERRTRAVFEALSLLTGVVISLDEFDPVLWRRNPNDPSPRSVFSFLTPGMLPKLKELHKQAKRRRVAYGLITNLVGGLEPAAIREGRFDSRVGVYPPDPLSRAGRLLTELLAFAGRDLTAAELRRAYEVVARTAGAGMPALTRPGWFVKPESVGPDTPFHFVLADGPEPFRPEPEAEAVVAGKDKIAIRENQQWLWIAEWDRMFNQAGDREQALNEPPRTVPSPKYGDAPVANSST